MFLAFSGCGTSDSEAEPMAAGTEDLDVTLPGDDGVPTGADLQPPNVDVDVDDAAHLKMRAAEPTPTESEEGPGEEQVASGTEPAGDPPAPPTSAGDSDEGPSVSDVVAAVDANAPESWQEWESPEVVLAITGHQHGYIEPCGCTGLANQKGGMMRRYTFYETVRQKEWPLVPLDAGNQVRRFGQQAEIKFQTAVRGLREMNYQAIGLGPDDLRLGAGLLLSEAADDGESDNPFASANIELLAPELLKTYRIIEQGKLKIGVTTAVDPTLVGSALDDGIIIADVATAAKTALDAMESEESNFQVLLFYGSAEAAEQLARDVPGYEIIVAADTYGEPYYKAQEIEGSQTRLIKTGDKGMYVGLLGLFEDGSMKYSRVPLDDAYEDARPMLDLMATYQDQLKQLGFDGLYLKPKEHPSGGSFVGSERCGECHTNAYEVWESSAHYYATEDIVEPGERSEIARHFDPECLSCHVTGWSPQEYTPFTSGYLSLEATPLLTGNGCENCHGPGKAHAEAEEGGDYTDEEIETLRAAVRLVLDDARKKCLECHDLDNSPDFHLDGAFDEYWEQVEHYGVD